MAAAFCAVGIKRTDRFAMQASAASKPGYPPCVKGSRLSRSTSDGISFSIPYCQQTAQYPAPAVMIRHRGLPMGVPKQWASTGTPSPLRTELMEHRFLFDAAMGWLKK